MRQAIWILVMVAGVGGIVTSTTSRQRNADSNSSIPGIEIPSGYRDWKLISGRKAAIPGWCDHSAPGMELCFVG